MANSAQSKKRARQADKRRALQMSQRAKMRTMIKKVRAMIEKSDKDGAMAAFRAAVPVLDGMVTKGLMHMNTISRYKSRMNKRLKLMA